jgi:hypothetical protein
MPYSPIDICQKFVSCVKHTLIYEENSEADDVIASYISNHQTDVIFLVSTDKDLWQLKPKHPNLHIMLGSTEELTDEEIVKEKFDGGGYDHILLHKVIRGEPGSSGDNIKSVYRYPFASTQQSFLRCDGSIEDFLRCVGEDFGTDSKPFNKLLENAYLIRLNYWVARLNPNLTYVEKKFPTHDVPKWNELCEFFQTPSLVNSGMFNIF